VVDVGVGVPLGEPLSDGDSVCWSWKIDPNEVFGNIITTSATITNDAIETRAVIRWARVALGFSVKVSTPCCVGCPELASSAGVLPSNNGRN
jgi:hypothetical protein